VDAQHGLIAGRATGDLLADFEQVSALSLGNVLGIPKVGAEEFRHWFRGLIAGGRTSPLIRLARISASGSGPTCAPATSSAGR